MNSNKAKCNLVELLDWKVDYSFVFLFTEKPFIDIKEPWTKVWEVDVGEDVGDQTAQIPVTYSAYPEPSFKWCGLDKMKKKQITYNAACCRWCWISDLFLLPRLKNGEALKDDYRIKQRSDALTIHRVTETDAGNYTVILSNKMTKEEQRRSVQLLVNGTFCPVYFLFTQLLPVGSIWHYLAFFSLNWHIIFIRSFFFFFC